MPSEVGRGARMASKTTASSIFLGDFSDRVDVCGDASRGAYHGRKPHNDVGCAMKKSAIGITVGLIGVAFLVFYLVVRVVFMTQLDAAVEQANVHSVDEILANLTPPVLVWLLWAYSFRVGMLLAVFGGALYGGIGRGEMWLIGTVGAAYLATCYLPFVEYSAHYYGILGTGILVLFLLLVWDWAQRRATLANAARVAGDVRMAGYFFLVMATWSLCGIFGIVTYALQPQIMLARGLEPAAAMLTSHVMAELALGWFLLVLGSRLERRQRFTGRESFRAGIATPSSG